MALLLFLAVLVAFGVTLLGLNQRATSRQSGATLVTAPQSADEDIAQVSLNERRVVRRARKLVVEVEQFLEDLYE